MDARGLNVRLPCLPLPQRVALSPLLSAYTFERFTEQVEVTRRKPMPSSDTTGESPHRHPQTGVAGTLADLAIQLKPHRYPDPKYSSLYLDVIITLPRVGPFSPPAYFAFVFLADPSLKKKLDVG